MPDRTVVCNTSPLLYLYQVGQLGLLQSLYKKVHVPPAVREELLSGQALGCPTPDLSTIPWIQIEPLQDKALLPMVVDLGQGEAEAIGLALSHRGSLLILDDSLGRRIAHSAGLTYTGTLGVLVKAKQDGFLPRVGPVIESLRKTTMYLSAELISLVLRESGEV
jgi:uncharacterized protein